jgi:hypothetical protein
MMKKSMLMASPLMVMGREEHMPLQGRHSPLAMPTVMPSLGQKWRMRSCVVRSAMKRWVEPESTRALMSFFYQYQRQLNGLIVGDTGEGVEGDLGVGVIDEGVLHGVIIVHIEEVDPLHGALLEVIPRNFFGAVKAQPLFMVAGHLLRCEPRQPGSWWSMRLDRLTGC